MKCYMLIVNVPHMMSPNVALTLHFLGCLHSSMLFLPSCPSGATPQLGDVPCISDILGARPCIKKPVRAPILF